MLLKRNYNINKGFLKTTKRKLDTILFSNKNNIYIIFEISANIYKTIYNYKCLIKVLLETVIFIRKIIFISYLLLSFNYYANSLNIKLKSNS